MSFDLRVIVEGSVCQSVFALVVCVWHMFESCDPDLLLYKETVTTKYYYTKVKQRPSVLEGERQIRATFFIFERWGGLFWKRMHDPPIRRYFFSTIKLTWYIYLSTLLMCVCQCFRQRCREDCNLVWIMNESNVVVVGISVTISSVRWRQCGEMLH